MKHTRFGWRQGSLAGLLLVASLAYAQPDGAIFDAARLGSGKEVEKLLTANPQLLKSRTALGSTPLHLAATNASPEALKVLIARGADVNARDGDGVTPLHMAAFADRAESARLLLKAGAIPDPRDAKGATPQDYTDRAQTGAVKAELVMWMLTRCKQEQGKAQLSC